MPISFPPPSPNYQLPNVAENETRSAPLTSSHSPSGSPPDEHFNPNLRSEKNGNLGAGFKRYLLNGKQWGPVYSISEKLTREALPYKKLGGEGNHNVFRRRNPESPFIKKIVSTYSRAEINNEIALLVNENPDKRDHFSVEIAKKIVANQTIFIAKRVDGFTVLDYKNKQREFSEKFPDLTPEKFLEKLKDLESAVKWLYGQGYIHCDIHDKNIMYDVKSKKMVLIDFESSIRSTDDEKFQSYCTDVFEDISKRIKRSGALTLFDMTNDDIWNTDFAKHVEEKFLQVSQQYDSLPMEEKADKAQKLENARTILLQLDSGTQHTHEQAPVPQFAFSLTE